MFFKKQFANINERISNLWEGLTLVDKKIDKVSCSKDDIDKIKAEIGCLGDHFRKLLSISDIVQKNEKNIQELRNEFRGFDNNTLDNERSFVARLERVIHHLGMRKCLRCNGTGTIFNQVCPECNGAGLKKLEKKK
jgi:hypothetical protein